MGRPVLREPSASCPRLSEPLPEAALERRAASDVWHTVTRGNVTAGSQLQVHRRLRSSRRASANPMPGDTRLLLPKQPSQVVFPSGETTTRPQAAEWANLPRLTTQLRTRLLSQPFAPGCLSRTTRPQPSQSSSLRHETLTPDAVSQSGPCTRSVLLFPRRTP
jgi:hypothetical protein